MEFVSTNALVFADIQRMCECIYGQDPSHSDTVLVFGYNVADFSPAEIRSKHPGKRIVAYQLEQLFDGSKWATRKACDWLRGCDEVWEYDRANMDWLATNGIKAVYRPLCYCESMRDIVPMDKDIDVLFYGYPSPRRVRTMSYWMSRSWDRYSTVDATGITGGLLKEFIARSKIILNLHSFVRNCRQEQVRMFYPVINGACVVSEASPHNEFGKAIIEVPPDPRRIAAVLHSLLKTGDWERIGEAAPDVYREHCNGRK